MTEKTLNMAPLELIIESRSYCLEGQFDRAASLLCDFTVPEEWSDPEEHCSFLISKSYVGEFRGTWTESFVALRKALIISRENKLYSWELETHCRMATLFARRGDFKAALFHIDSGDALLALDISISPDSMLLWLTGKGGVLRFCNQVPKAEEALSRAIECARGVTPSWVIRALFASGEFFYRLSRLDRAQIVYDEVSCLLERSGEQTVFQPELMYRRGLMATKRGRLDQGLGFFQESLHLFEENMNSEGVGRCFMAIGSVQRLSGNNNAALEYYSQCRSLRRDTGDTLGYAQVLGEIATVFRNRGELEMALDCYTQSLEIRQRAGDKYSEALVLNDLAMVCRYRGDYGSAFSYYRQSLETKRRTGDLFGQALTLNEYSLALKDTGSYKEALEAVEEGLAIADKINAITLLIALINNKANIIFFFGDAEKALFLLKDNLKRIDRTGCGNEKQVTYGALADIYRSLGRYDEAWEVASLSADAAAENNSKRGAAFSHLQLALISADRGAPFAAIHDFTACRQIRETLEDAKGLVEVLWREATVQESVGNTSAALVAYRRAFSIADSCSFRRARLIARLGLLALEHSPSTLGNRIKEAECLLFTADELEFVDGLFWATYRLAHFYHKVGNSITALKFLSSAASHMNAGAWAGGKTTVNTTVEEFALDLVKDVTTMEEDFISHLMEIESSDTLDSLNCDDSSCERVLVCLTMPTPDLDELESSSPLSVISEYMAIDRAIVPKIISGGGSLVYQGWKRQFIAFTSDKTAAMFLSSLNPSDGYIGAREVCRHGKGCCSFDSTRRTAEFSTIEKSALARVLKKISAGIKNEK